MDVLRKGEIVKLYIPAFESHSRVEMLTDSFDPNVGVISSLGIFVVELNKSTADSLPKVRSSLGVIVAGKADYTPTIDASLSVGDVIRSVNGVVLTGAGDLRSELERFKPGDPVVLEIERQGTYQFVSFEME
jgi:S1-C subfamily serine protease